MGPNLPNPMHAVVNALSGAARPVARGIANVATLGEYQHPGGLREYGGQVAHGFDPTHPAGLANIFTMLLGRKVGEMPIAPRAPMHTLDPLFLRQPNLNPSLFAPARGVRAPGQRPSQVMVNQLWLQEQAKLAAQREAEIGTYTPPPLPPPIPLAKAIRNSVEAPTMWGRR